MSNFVFTNDDFVLGGDYTPSYDFAISNDDLLVSIDQPQHQNDETGQHPFYFKYTLKPSNIFRFEQREKFYIRSQENYTPSNHFEIPWRESVYVPPVTISGELTATFDDMTGAFVGQYDTNVTRLFTIKTNSTCENTTTNIDDKTCMFVDQSLPKNVDIESAIEQAIKEFDKTCVLVDNTTILPSVNTCGVYEQAVMLFKRFDVLYNQLDVFNVLNPCVIVEECNSIDLVIESDKQQMTKVYPDKWCIESEDMADTIHSFTWDYWDEVVPGDNYVPSDLFSIAVKPEYNDGRGTFVFNDEHFIFTGINYTPSHTFTMLLNTRPINQLSPPIVKLNPEGDIFQWDGVWQKFYNSDSYQRGGYRLSKFNLLDQATFTDLKQCVIVEETKQPDRGRTPWVDIPRPDPDPNPPSGSKHTVPIQEVYTMLNTIIVTLDDDVTPIELNSIQLSIDADSSAWSFSGDLHDPDDISLVKQLPDGTAIELHITINGYSWHVLVEKIQTNRVFGNQSVKISGRGLTALLSKPYEQPVSVNIGTDTDIRVIADNLLPIGWNSLGALYWLLGDDPVASPVSWIVDGGAYSYQNKTPMEAIKEFAEDIGAMLVPSRDSKELYFKSRYTVLPWNFSGITVDIAIPDSAILKLTEEPVSSFQANGVYIHGDEIGGELAFVRLNGTAGDRLAPTINNSLMTDVVGLRSLGERLLSGQYSQPKIKSITTFMDGTIVPLIELGDFVGLTVDSVETKGVVNAVSIDVSFGDVTQSITIGESTPNTWVAFKEILPKDPMLVGTLVSTDGTTSLMTLLDGGVVRVRGTGVVTQKYYIRSGEIVSEAPNLAESLIVL